MNMEERIARINALYHKSRGEGLTEDEKAEQARLRQEYVASVRNNLKSQLDNLVIEKPDGSTIDLGKSMADSMDKREIRRQALALRGRLSDGERERARVLLTERILGHQWFYRSSALLGFAACGSEIDIKEILNEALRLGKKVYLPRVTDEAEGRMAFCRIDAWEDVSPGYRGIPEPGGGAEAYEYHEEEAKQVLMLMPGVAFDSRRNRIGYGRGFYDRYLADKPALQLRTIAVGFRCQMREEIPCGEYDIRPCQVICM